ncbi:histidine-type phosphatase [Microbacter margulisiae]|uniref:Multiple inositol polyphosphate phosphatase 1 n=1 Tax=Microbacter margulisiae TaxID=1350067 RepID=A0A7W5H1U7_9PORP|nr:histidine-type phosphatase [Microbacter margulisiae]MBB3186737.1 hypothetical protein [Microbacter margulisiae]
MKKILLFGLLFSCIFGLNAQTAKEEIYANVQRSGGNYYAYPGPENAKQTPPPAGYKPFYISTYARHGSRFLIDEGDYTKPLAILQKADQAGKLTPLGKEVMAVVDSMARMSRGRLGELTPLGAIQHEGIARRMFNNFPQVFSGHAYVDARSTVVIRCILSMMDECLQLKGMNPEINIKNDASMHDMYYMNYDDKTLDKLRELPEVKAAYLKFRNEHTHPERLMKTLFTDENYVKENVNPDILMKELFNLAANMQSHKYQTNMDLYHIFTKQECYDLWQVDNFRWYIDFGPSPLTEGKMPYVEANLLNNILNTADTCILKKGNGATLRFGHDVCIVPLESLMELGNCAKEISNPDQLANEWRTYKVVAMGSNIQLVFFRKQGSKDVLVKALLNEHEMSLPVKSDLAPYYHWKDVEAYYRHKLANFRNSKM